MSISSSGSNFGDSGASFGGLRIEFFSTSYESLHIETEREVREDSTSEHAESLWLRRDGYEWVAEGVRTCFSKYRWSRLLRSWLSSVYLFERGAGSSVVSIERVSGVETVCHGREGLEDDFFYMYACMFMKLHVQRDRDQQAWAYEKKKLEAEVKRLKASVATVEKKLKAKQVEFDEYHTSKDATVEEAASEIYGLQQAIYSKHVNGFQKALRQTDFLYKEVSVTDCCFNVNLDVYDNRMFDILEISRLKDAQEAATVGNEGTVVMTPPANVDGDMSEREDEGEEVEEADDPEEVTEGVNDNGVE